MGETDAGNVPPDLVEDPEARLEFLLDRGVLAETDGTLTTTAAFDDVRGIYHDSYGDEDDEVFRETVGDVFGLSSTEAAERIEELGVTRDELVTYLALQSYLDVELSRQALTLSAAMVATVWPDSPIPGSMTELTDDDYETFLAERGDVVVFVWKHHCSPCEEMKSHLDELRAATPDGVVLAGVDGESVVEFRREFDVEAAPTTLFFVDGEFVDGVRGWRSPAAFADAVADVYG